MCFQDELSQKSSSFISVGSYVIKKNDQPLFNQVELNIYFKGNNHEKL